MKCSSRACFLLLAAGFVNAVAARHHHQNHLFGTTTITTHHGWTLTSSIPRGGSHDEVQSTDNNQNGKVKDDNDYETEEWSQDEEADDDETDADDDDLEEFLDAQEFIEEEVATVEGEANVEVEEDVATEEMLGEDDEGSYEIDEDVVQFEEIEEETTPEPETDFDKQIPQQEDTPSTEDASQVEADFSANVDEREAEIVQEQDAPSAETVADFIEPTIEEASLATDTRVEIPEAEIVEEQAPFAAASQAAANMPSEMDFSQQHTTDDDSMAFVDRMELADDEGEDALNGIEEEIMEGDENGVAEETAAVEEIPPVQDETTADVTVESVTVIDDDTRRVLMKELKFHRREVNGMRPEIAMILAEKRLRRPSEGIPPTWFTDEAKHKRAVGATRQKNAIVKIILFPIAYAVPIALGGLALYGGADLAELFSTLTSSNTAKTSSKTSSDSEETESPPASLVAQTDKAVTSPTRTETGAIPPFEDSRLPSKKETEESWLDKVISGIVQPIQAFWNIKI